MQYHHQEVIEVVEYVDDDDWEGGSDSEEEVVVEVVEQRIVEPPGVSRSRPDLLRRQSSVMQIAPHEVGIGQQQYELVVESTQTRNHQLPRITTASHTNIYHRYNNSGDDRESEEEEEEEVYVQQLVTIPAPLRRQSSVMQISPHEVGIGQKELIIESTHHPNIPTTNPYGLYNNRANNIEDDDEGEWSESEEEVFVVEQVVTTIPAVAPLVRRQPSVIITPQDVGIGLREYVVESSRNLLQGIDDNDNDEEDTQVMDDAPQEVGTQAGKQSYTTTSSTDEEEEGDNHDDIKEEEEESPEDRKVREQLEAEIAELDRQIYVERSSRNLLQGIEDHEKEEEEDTHALDAGTRVAAAGNQSYYISSTDEEEEEEDYYNKDDKESEEDQEESEEDRKLREQLEAEIAELERKIEQRKAEKRNSCVVVSPPPSPSSPPSSPSKEKKPSEKNLKRQQQPPLVLNREDSATSVTSKSTNSDGDQPFPTASKKKKSFNLGVRASMRMSLVAAKAVKKLRERLVTAQLRNRLRAHTKKKQQQQQQEEQEEEELPQKTSTTTSTTRVQNTTVNNNDPWHEIIGAIGTAHKSLRPLPKSKRRDSTTWVNKDHPYMRELREVQAEVLPVWRKETYDYWI